jgi:hypothetical protein
LQSRIRGQETTQRLEAPQSAVVPHKPPALKKIYLKLGELGNQIRQHPSFYSMRRESALHGMASHQEYCMNPMMRLLILALILLAGCAAATRNYAGDVRPIAGTCDPASQAVLTIRDKAIIFAPASGTIFLRGALAGQSANADLTLTDPNKHPYHLTFQGVLEGRSISGTYTTPRCRYAATLHLIND